MTGTAADPRFDPSVAHPARVYNYWLGGKDNNAADRQAGEEVMRLRPEVVAGARANRYFLARLVRFLAAGRGVRQFLDIGTGLPAVGNTHEIAQDVAPQCRVVYVDNDPLVLANARALLISKPGGFCGYVDADLCEPAAIVDAAAEAFDFRRPVAVLLLAVLHFIREDPAKIVAELAGPLAAGSFVAISHLTADFAPEQVTSGVGAYNTLVPAGITARTHSEVTALFGGLPMVAPGVVPVAGWRPDFPECVTQRADLYAGVAEKLPRRAGRGPE